MKVKRMGITDILRGTWLFSENEIKRSNLLVSTHRRTQLIIAAHNCHTLHKARSCPFIQILSQFYFDFVLILSKFHPYKVRIKCVKHFDKLNF